MAIIDNKGIIRGAVGPSVFRHSRGKNIIQSKSRKYKQTAPSIASSAEFGLISSTAAVIRHAFEPAYRYYDGRVGGRMTSAVGRSVRGGADTICGQRDLHDGDLSCLLGMEFNKNSLLKDVLLVQPQILRDENGGVLVRMPALNMKTDLKLPSEFSRKGYKLRVRFLLLAFNFRESYYEYVDNQEMEYLLHQKAGAQEINLNGDIPQGCMLLLSMSISLYGGHVLDEGPVLLNSKAFSPAALVGAWQEPGLIPLSEANPAAERPGRITVDYAGNRLLASLPRKVMQKARGQSGSGWVKQAELKRGSPGNERTGSGQKKSSASPAMIAEGLFIKGKRVDFKHK